MQIFFLILMFVLGAIFGSFLCCQVRRMEARCSTRGIAQRSSASVSAGRPWRSPLGPRIAGGKRAGRTRSEREHELPNRSICLHCKKQLKWYDNIPIISWLVLKGKCRFCHKKIGLAEFLSEIFTALALLAIGTTINIDTATALEWLQFILIAIFTLLLVFLAIYDGISGKLPTIALIISIVLAVAIITPGLITNFSVMPFLSALLFGGIYLILYLVSRGKWVGDGDWLLTTAIGLALGHPWLSVIALFIANLSACTIMLQTVKKSPNHQIYFGPFLVFAFVVTYTFSDFFISVL